MDEDVATRILQMATTCSREVDRSVEIAMSKCNEEEFRAYRRHAGVIMASIFYELMVPIYTEYPNMAPDWYRAMDAAGVGEKDNG